MLPWQSNQNAVWLTFSFFQLPLPILHLYQIRHLIQMYFSGFGGVVIKKSFFKKNNVAMETKQNGH